MQGPDAHAREPGEADGRGAKPSRWKEQLGACDSLSCVRRQSECGSGVVFALARPPLKGPRATGGRRPIQPPRPSGHRLQPGRVNQLFFVGTGSRAQVAPGARLALSIPTPFQPRPPFFPSTPGERRAAAPLTSRPGSTSRQGLCVASVSVFVSHLLNFSLFSNSFLSLTQTPPPGPARDPGCAPLENPRPRRPG